MSTSDGKYGVLELQAIATIKHTLNEKYDEYVAGLRANNPECHIQTHAADATLEEWARQIFHRHFDKDMDHQDPTADEIRRWIEAHVQQ